MRAEVKRWWRNEEPYAPSLVDNADDRCVSMQAEIGPVGEDGGGTFSFDVCTPTALARRLDSDRRPYWARGMLVVDEFSSGAVEAALQQLVRSVSGDDWDAVAAKLNRVMHWEFEDYRPYKPR